jgi:hypothetical protein|nr:hypothetical protein [uncultured Rhodopila sp.]
MKRDDDFFFYNDGSAFFWGVVGILAFSWWLLVTIKQREYGQAAFLAVGWIYFVAQTFHAALWIFRRWVGWWR